MGSSPRNLRIGKSRNRSSHFLPPPPLDHVTTTPTEDQGHRVLILMRYLDSREPMSFPSWVFLPQKVFNPWFTLNKVYTFTSTIKYISMKEQGPAQRTPALRITNEGKTFILKITAKDS